MRKNLTVVVDERGSSKWQKDDICYFDMNTLESSIEREARKNELAIEGQKKAKVYFSLQTAKNPRKVIKFLDSILSVKGKFEMTLIDSQAHSNYFRSTQQIKYEFSVSTNGRYRLDEVAKKDGFTKIIYTKEKGTLPQGDDIEKWTFGIVSGGQQNNWVKELIKTIEAQSIQNHEILVCGPNPYETEEPIPEPVKIIDDHFPSKDIRAPIAFKKNKIINHAKFNNICILHDRYLLPNEWHINMKAYGNFFDVLCLKNLNNQEKRFSVDWMKFGYPINSRFRLNRSLTYDEWHHDAIIPGGVMIFKKHLIEENTFDERLFWDELEDMQISKMAYLNGMLISLDKNNYFISREVRHKTHKSDWIEIRLNSIFRWIKSLLKNVVLYKIKIRKYKED